MENKVYYLETLNPQLNIVLAEAIVSKGMEPINCQRLIKFKNHHIYTWEVDRQIIQNLVHSKFKFGHDWLLYCEQNEEFYLCCPKSYSYKQAKELGATQENVVYSLSTEKIKNIIKDFKTRLYISQSGKKGALAAEKFFVTAVKELIFGYCRLVKKINQDKNNTFLLAIDPEKEQKLEHLKYKWQKIDNSLANKKKEILVDDACFIFDTLAALREYVRLRSKLEKIMIAEIIRVWRGLGRKPKYSTEIATLIKKKKIVNIRYLLFYQDLFDGSYRRLISVAEQIKEMQKMNNKEKRVAQWAQSPEGQKELQDALTEAKSQKFKQVKQLTFKDLDKPIFKED